MIRKSKRLAIAPTSRPDAALRRGGSVGIAADSAAALIDYLSVGLRFSNLEQLQRQMNLPLERIANFARISTRTLARRRREGQLNLDESERVYRLAMVFEKAVGLFEGNREAAMRWLQTPRNLFAGKTPLDFAKTDVGAREVEDVIDRLEYGVIQ